jgi:hypothetical protein
MARVALLSNPRSTGNRSLLPRVRSFCAEHKDIFHYEVEHVDQIGAALRTIARVNPKVLVINGGDGTVQAALTEIYNGRHFGDDPPPVAVLPTSSSASSSRCPAARPTASRCWACSWAAPAWPMQCSIAGTSCTRSACPTPSPTPLP